MIYIQILASNFDVLELYWLGIARNTQEDAALLKWNSGVSVNLDFLDIVIGESRKSCFAYKQIVFLTSKVIESDCYDENYFAVCYTPGPRCAGESKFG